MNLKPLEGLSNALRVLLKINIIITVIAVLAGIYDYYSYSQLPLGVDVSETVLPSDALVGIMGIVQFVLFLILGITFLRWIHRTNKNLHTLSSRTMIFSPGWAIGWYFIPIANLWKPYQAMKEIWEVSHREKNANHTLLKWWWFLWIVSTVLGRIAFKLIMKAEDTEGYIASAAAYIVSDGMDLALHLVALLLVTRIWTAYSTNYVEQTVAPDGDSADAPPPPVT